MSDKELLELAAKAAGYKSVDWYDDEYPHGSALQGYLYLYDHNKKWNPLTDDGDALRLAVKLEIDISYWPDNYVTCTYPGEPMSAEDISEPFIGDPYAATRRAIVRAAAEIRGMLP